MSFEREDARAALVIFNGRTECFIRYAEFIYDLRDLPISLYLMDHRGQGFSDRLLDDPEKGYVVEYQDYLYDAKLFVDSVVRSRQYEKLFVLGHSLGGAITALHAEIHPGDFDAIILSAPALSLVIRPIEMAFIRLMRFFGMGRAYVPTTGPFEEAAFDENFVTHSRVRYARRMKDSEIHPETRLGGPTVRWLTEAEKMVQAVMAGAGRLNVPVLLLQAGEDVYVDSNPQDEFCDRVIHCEKVIFKDARHEMLLEADHIRNRVLREIRGFLLDHMEN